MPRRNRDRHRSARHHLAVVLAAAVLAAGCGGLPAGAAATVDGAAVPRTVLEAEVRARTAGLGAVEALPPAQREAAVGDAQQDVLALLIEVQAVRNLGDAQGVDVSAADVDAWLEGYIQDVGGEDAYVAALAMQGWTRTLFEEVFVPAQLVVEGLQSALLEDPPGLELRSVRHILVETAQAAAEVLAALADGEDFAALAAARSQDPGSGALGGELGPAPRGAYVPEFDAAAWEAAIGEVVGPVQTAFGYHILEVTGTEEISPAQLGPFEVQQLVNQEVNRLLAESIEDAEVVVAPGLGSWDPATRRVTRAGAQVGVGTPGPAGFGGLGSG